MDCPQGTQRATHRQECIWNRALRLLSRCVLSLRCPLEALGCWHRLTWAGTELAEEQRENGTELLRQARSERLGLQRGQRVEGEKIRGPAWDIQAEGGSARGGRWVRLAGLGREDSLRTSTSCLVLAGPLPCPSASQFQPWTKLRHSLLQGKPSFRHSLRETLSIRFQLSNH